ncbi:hypothetical protein AB4084_25905, partial [Lysobacter sp. 2RAB21]
NILTNSAKPDQVTLNGRRLVRELPASKGAYILVSDIDDFDGSDASSVCDDKQRQPRFAAGQIHEVQD